MRTRLRPFAALALVALMSAGCGSDAGGDTASGGGASSAQNAGDRDKLVRFAACMRENGVADFPDPDASGDFDYGISVSGEVWNGALDACRELRPAGSFSANRNAEQQAAGLEFAKCIRKNGVKDFPDPANGDPLVDTNKIPSANRKGGMTVLNAAMKTCADVGAKALDEKP